MLVYDWTVWSPWRGVEGPVGISAAYVARLVGSGRVGWAVVRRDMMWPKARGGGKKLISSGFRRQVACKGGDRIV